MNEKQTDQEQIISGKKLSSSESGSPKYWLSLEQWAQDPEFHQQAQNEFRSSPLGNGEGQEGWARREFLKVMGASMALSTFGCVRRPVQKIVPYVKRPPEITPGKINYYTSSFADGSMGYGLVVATREGRPIKVEGNESHPVNKGGMSARSLAHLLSLYDPDRAQGPQKNELNQKKTNFEPITATMNWEKLDQAVAAEFKKGSLGILTSTLLSPSTHNLVQEFARAYGAKWYIWEPLSMEVVRSGQKSCYGQDVLPRIRLDKAKYIVSIEADFLGTYGQPVEHMKQFSQGRKPQQNMNKLVCFESLMSLTGSNADERYRILPSQQLDVVMGLIHELVLEAKVSRYSNDNMVKEILAPYGKMAEKLGIDSKVFSHIAADLWAHRGQSLVLAGGMTGQTEGQQSVQVAVNFLNSLLENDGMTIESHQGVYQGYQGNSQNLQQLIKDMESGKVKRLLIYGVNPAYSVPEDSGFKEAFQKVETGVYVGDRVDETGRTCNYFAPDHHEMENWSDMEVVSGVYSIQQPTIQPLYDTRSFQDSLLKWAQMGGVGSANLKAESWYEYLQAYWKNSIYARHRSTGLGRLDFEEFWYQLLQTGIFDTQGESSKSSGSSRSFSIQALQIIKQETQALKRKEIETVKVKDSNWELVIYPTVGLMDGRLANVSWLQEFPDPVTKICWDNYACLSPQSARELKVCEGDEVKISVHGKTLEVPAHIQPGQADHVIGLAVGYGRTAAGRVANGVGVNAYTLASLKEGQTYYSGLAAQIQKTGKKNQLACVQDHHSMEGRQIVVEATLDQYLQNPGANIHRHEMSTMWSGHEYKSFKWAMVVDQNVCTGCSACVIACQSENNIPVVGKKYVLNGREMHWLRIDRYFTGQPQDPGVVYQPLPCQQCDNAPCETVCPVAATTHSSEGINEMTYNRCVGTRYCSNNCYYKVRRFNWFDYTQVTAPMHLALNPEVTVRSRGVMEKCTFCVHRIKGAKHWARVEAREFKAEEVKTACQQACPTGAIIFGDMNDPNSQVSQRMKEVRSYSLLEEFNAAPAVRYQTKIRNTDHLKTDSHSSHREGHHS